ncbi:MAG TPA: cobalamin-dependent protein, partial [Vicinamibacterales bacterium]|nr:cobalamin-dependent protein [Vicinamibacterales bacterium]
MRVLLLSMPDSFEHTPSLTMRMPNAGLASLAGNVDDHHEVAIADLICVQGHVSATVRRLMREVRPQVVGLSVMTFQRRTAHGIVRLVREIDPSVTVVTGGYDPSLAPEEYEHRSRGVDAIVRGEGDLTFRELVRAIETRAPLDAIAGLSWRRGPVMVHNPPRPVSALGEEVRPPRRAARVLDGYTFLGRPIDIVETSRGCTYDCSFCSI